MQLLLRWTRRISPSNPFQLLLGDPEVFPGQTRFMIPPASVGSTPGLLPVKCAWTASRRRCPGSIPIRCLDDLIRLLFNTKEDWLCSKLHPDVQSPHQQSVHDIPTPHHLMMSTFDTLDTKESICAGINSRILHSNTSSWHVLVDLQDPPIHFNLLEKCPFVPNWERTTQIKTSSVVLLHEGTQCQTKPLLNPRVTVCNTITHWWTVRCTDAHLIKGFKAVMDKLSQSPFFPAIKQHTNIFTEHAHTYTHLPWQAGAWRS